MLARLRLRPSACLVRPRTKETVDLGAYILLTV